MSIMPEDHAPEDEGHYFELRISFHAKETEPGEEPELLLGHIESHIHGAPPSQLCDSLLIVARDIVSSGMKEQMFNESVPEAVRDIAARVMATQYLLSRLQSEELVTLDPINALVPDDISSLLEPEG